VRPATVQDLVLRLPTFGDRPALGLRAAYAARWWSYRELHAHVHGFAEVLAARGIGRGDRVAVWGANSPEWGAAALGALLRGAVVVPIDADATPARARAVASAAEPRLLLHDDDVDAHALGVPSLALRSVEHASEPRVEVVAVSPEDPAVLLYTSGSTRDPRPLVLTHRNLASQVGSFRRWRLLTRLRAFRLLALSPLGHVQGLVVGLLVPLSLGLGVLYSESVAPAHVIATIRGNRINLLLAVPGVQRLLADALRNDRGADGRTLAERTAGIRRFLVRRHVLFLATHRRLGYTFWTLLVGGATLPPEDERFWYEAGYVVAQGYGLTETSALVTVRVNSPLGARLGSVGRALGEQHVRVADDGQVLVRGPNVVPGEADPDGWLRTGDLGRFDRAGRLWLRGRANDVIVTGEGLNVHAEDVEAALRSVAGVHDAVVGDAEGRGQVHAVLLLDRGERAEAAVAQANASLEPYERVRSWSVWPEPEFPRTSLLKVRRADVLARARARAGEPRAADAAVDLEAVRGESDRRRRLELLARHVADGSVDGGPDPRIDELGLGSLDAVELLTLLEELAARPLDATVTPATTVADLRLALERPPRRSGLPTRQPRWAGALPGRCVRAATRPLLVGGWSQLSARVSTVRPASWPGRPVIVAAAPHRHWLDAFAVQAALPPRVRTITATNRDFRERFDPAPGAPRGERLAVGLAYHLLWPLAFEFAIVPNYGSTREGLHELGRALDRGLSPIAFPKGLAPPGAPNPRHEPGMAVLAVQSETPVVPAWLEGNDGLSVVPRGRRAHVRVRFGEPIAVRSTTSPEDVVERVERAYAELAGAGA
jgi:long-chain acyl-CoA synthetase